MKFALENRSVLLNLIIVIFTDLVASFNVYLISFYTKYMGGVIFITIILLDCAKVASNWFSGVLQKLLGT